MSRHTVVATPSSSLWASLEAAARAAASRFSLSGDAGSVLASLDREQNQIRQTGRHWLLG